MKQIILFILLVFVYTGCSSSNNNVGISKVYQSDYPQGISMILGNSELQKNIKILDARLVNGQYKKQIQFTLSNISKYNYNLKITPQWSDSQGSIILASTKYKLIKVNKNSLKRVILKAPNSKAKNILLNIECAQNCKE